MGILIQPNLWTGTNDESPPDTWEAFATDDRWYFDDSIYGFGVGAIVRYPRTLNTRDASLGFADGAGVFSGSAVHGGIVPTTVLVRAFSFSTFDNEFFTDDGSGVLIGDLGGTGSINYTTGAFNIVTQAGAQLTFIDYNYLNEAYPPLPGSLSFEWEILEVADNSMTFHYSIDGVQTDVPMVATTGTIDVIISNPDAVFVWSISTDSTSQFYTGRAAIGEGAAGAYDIDLDWTTGTAGTFPIVAWNLYRSINDAAFSLLEEALAVRVYTDSLVTSGANYRYYVTSIDSDANESTASNIFEADVP